jgi:hypothetical protein
MNNQQTPCVIEEEFSGADAEMARRLLSLRRDPSPALVARVRGIPTLSQRQVWHVPRWAWGVAAAVALLTVLVMASPPLRAAIVSLQETIGNVSLTITDRSPDTSDATIVEPELMSLEAARTAVPFDFGIPSQVPDGWVMDEQVRVNDLGGGPFVEILWTNPDHARGGISFSARSARQDDGSPGSWLVGADSFQKIEIGGWSAVIVKGGWDYYSREWAWPEVTTLIWTVDDVEYTLSTSDSEGSEARLMAMAESTR